MKKLLLLFMVITNLISGYTKTIDSEEQLCNKDLVTLAEEAMTDPAFDIKQAGGNQGYSIEYINLQEFLEQCEWGLQFLGDYKYEWQHYMSVGMLEDHDDRKETLLRESLNRILILQRFLRTQIEPHIKQQAIDDCVDIIVDSYTGALLYAADNLLLERVSIQL